MTEIEMYNPIFISSFQTILAILAAISFGLACRKRKELLSWFPGIIFLCAGIFFMGISIVSRNDYLELLAYVFSLGASIIIFIAVFKEYYNMFIKTKTQEKKASLKYFAAITMGAIDLMMIGLIFFML
ncbi:MAG: hypothetical protein ACFFAO_11430, partial [Candidatus Hermodarchaeota archaeon]